MIVLNWPPFSCLILFLLSDRPECKIRQESIGSGRWLLECEASSNPPVHNFTWIVNNKTVDEFARNGLLSRKLPKSGIDLQKSVIFLNEPDLHAYSCIATNNIASSNPCKLKIQQSITRK